MDQQEDCAMRRQQPVRRFQNGYKKDCYVLPRKYLLINF